MIYLSATQRTKIEENKRWINQMEFKTLILPRKFFISTTSFTSPTGTLGSDWHPFHPVQCPTVMSPSKWISFTLERICGLRIELLYSLFQLSCLGTGTEAHCHRLLISMPFSFMEETWKSQSSRSLLSFLSLKLIIFVDIRKILQIPLIKIISMMVNLDL